MTICPEGMFGWFEIFVVGFALFFFAVFVSIVCLFLIRLSEVLDKCCHAAIAKREHKNITKQGKRTCK